MEEQTQVTTNLEMRFTEKDKQDYETSRNGKIIDWSLFSMSVAMMWGYYTLLSSQYVFQVLFDNPDFAFVSMLTITVPQGTFYIVLLVSGLNHHDWMSFTTRVCLTMTANAVLAAILIVGMLEWYDNETVLMSMVYAVGLGVASGDALFEPAVYEISAIFPSERPTQMCAWGTGMAGILNIGVNIIIQLIVSGTSGAPLTADQARYQEVGFAAVMIVVSLANIAVYWFGVRMNPLYVRFVEQDNSLQGQREISKCTLPTANDPDDVEKDIKQLTLLKGSFSDTRPVKPPMVKKKFRMFQYFPELKEAASIVWPGALAVYLCYVTSLSVFPNIPGLMCLGSDYPNVSSWWFNLILLAYNTGDFVGRVKFGGPDVQWASENLSQMTTLGISILRMITIYVLIFTSAAPQLYNANIAMWVVWTTMLLTGLSNGWVSTSSLMRAPKHPSLTNAFLAKQAGCVSVVGLLGGIATGSIIGYILGQNISIGVCY
eukprot:CFRG7671T1